MRRPLETGLNTGHVSYSPMLANLLFKDVIREYAPTLVVLLLDATDIGDDFQYGLEAQRLGSRVQFDPPGADGVRYYGALYELLAPFVDDYLRPAFLYPIGILLSRLGLAPDYDYYQFQVTVAGIVETNRFFIYRHPLRETRPYFDATLDHIDALAAAVEQAGARLLLVVSPRFHHWNRKEAPDNWEADQYALDEPLQYELFRYFQDVAPQRAYGIFDLLPMFQETKEFPLVRADDPHWNARGHALVARALAERLLAVELTR